MYNRPYPETGKQINKLLQLITKKEMSYLLEISRPTLDKLIKTNYWKSYQNDIINFIYNLTVINNIDKIRIIENKLILYSGKNKMRYDLKVSITKNNI